MKCPECNSELKQIEVAGSYYWSCENCGYDVEVMQ